MRRTTGTMAVALPVASLLLGPWLFPPPTATDDYAPTSRYSSPVIAAAAQRPIEAAPQVNRTRRTASGGCGCKTIVVNASNLVRDAKIESGDASVRNDNVTYISAEFAQKNRAKVEVDQRARAVTGDAIAGQLIGVTSRAAGCANILIKASNVVEDSKVVSGDAKAENRNYVFLDPGVNRGDVDIEVDQRAIARSGQAIAGQIIGALNPGGSSGCRGRVDVDATNQVTDTKVESGEASELNKNVIKSCQKVGCRAELKTLLATVDQVDVCTATGCKRMNARTLADALKQQPEKKRKGESEKEKESKSAGKSGKPSPSGSPAADATPQPAGPIPGQAAPTATPTPAPNSS